MAEKKNIADPQKVYTIKFSKDQEPTLVAMGVNTNYYDYNGVCFLSPPDRPHMIRGKVGRLTRTEFIFISEGYKPGEWEFAELTYDVLKAGFYKQLYGGEELLKLVHNTKELQDYYRGHFPEYT